MLEGIPALEADKFKFWLSLMNWLTLFVNLHALSSETKSYET